MTYTIINKAFKSEEIYQYNDDGTYAVRDRFRKEVPLSEVDEWAGLSEEPVIIGNIDKPLFCVHQSTKGKQYRYGFAIGGISVLQSYRDNRTS